MKFVRWSLILLGVLLVLGGVLGGLALLPSVQRWALLRVTHGVPGLKFDVAGVSAGFSGVVLQKVSAEKRHVVVKAERLEADFSLTAFLFDRRLEISRLEVTGLDVDASHLGGTSSGATVAGAPAATPGLLANAQLPFDLALDNVRIEGRALLANEARQPPLAAQFTVTGGKIAPGHEGLLQLEATVKNGAAGVKVMTLRAHAGLRATLSSQRTFNKISLTTVIDAAGAGLSEENQLKLSADLFHSSAGENYEVTVDTVLHGARENLLKFQAQLPAGARQYAGDWELKVRSAQVEPFLLRGALPDFDFKGGGKFAFEPSGAAASVRGSLQGQVSRWESIDPTWRAIGPVKVDATFDGGQQTGVVKLAQLKAVVSGAKPMIEIQTTAPIQYDLGRHQLLTSGTGTDSLLHVNLAGVPLDWVRPFVSSLDVSGGAITGEFNLAPVAGSATATAVKGQVRVAELTVTQDGRPLLTRANVAVRTEATLVDDALEAPVLEVTADTPEGDVLKLAGKLSGKLVPNPPLSFVGTLNASSAKTLARWFPGGPVKVQGDLNLARHDALLEIQPGRLQVQQAGKDLVNLTILQAFTTNLDTHALVPRDPAQPVVKVALGRLPLGLLPVTEPGAVLGGWVEQGDFEVSVRGGKTVVRSIGALRLGDVSLTQGKQAALAGLAIEAAPVIEYGGPDDFKVQSGDVTVRAGLKGTLLTLKAEATGTPNQGTQATMTFALEAPALASQPTFAGAQALSAGRATGEIRAVLTSAQEQIEARLTLNGLVIAGSGRTLPVANIGFRGVARSNGALSVQAPILLDNGGRRSDLNFALELSPLAKGQSVDGRITGAQVDWEDLQGVLGVFVAAAASDDDEKPAPAAGGVAPDTTAAWSRFSGQVLLDIKSVTRGKDWAMTGLNGTLAIEPTRLSLPKLTAGFGDASQLNAKAELRFTGGPMPYRLTGDYALNDFDVGKLFKAFDPAKPPMLEGLFNVTANFTGNGETPARAIDRLHGEFQLNSHQGVFRGLQRTSNKISMASKAVDFIGSMLSNKLGKAAEKVAGNAVYVDQLAQSLAEIKYDLLSVKLSRDEQLNLSLQDISLVSAELRLNGQGEVTYVAGKDLLDQPLSATLALAARGKTEEILGKIGALSGAKDDLGYSKTKEPVPLTGTLGRPDPMPYFTKVAIGKLTDYLDTGTPPAK